MQNWISNALLVMMKLRICITFSINTLTPKRSGLISTENVLFGILSKQCPSSNLLNYLNRAAVGWAVSCSAFGLLTAQPQACAVLVLHRVFFF